MTEPCYSDDAVMDGQWTPDRDVERLEAKLWNLIETWRSRRWWRRSRYADELADILLASRPSPDAAAMDYLRRLIDAGPDPILVGRVAEALVVRDRKRGIRS